MFFAKKPDDPGEQTSRLVFWVVVYPVLWWLIWSNYHWGGWEFTAAFAGLVGGMFLGFRSLGILAGCLLAGRILGMIHVLPAQIALPGLFWSVLYVLPGLIAGVIVSSGLGLIKDKDTAGSGDSR